MDYFKITDEDNCTFNNTLWGEGVTHTAGDKESIYTKYNEHTSCLCTPAVIHAFPGDFLELALLVSPQYLGDYKGQKLWKAEGPEPISKNAFMVGVKHLTTIKEINILLITLEQRILWAKEVALRGAKKKEYINFINSYPDSYEQLEKISTMALLDNSWIVLSFCDLWRYSKTRSSDEGTIKRCTVYPSHDLFWMKRKEMKNKDYSSFRKILMDCWDKVN